MFPAFAPMGKTQFDLAERTNNRSEANNRDMQRCIRAHLGIADAIESDFNYIQFHMNQHLAVERGNTTKHSSKRKHSSELKAKSMNARIRSGVVILAADVLIAMQGPIVLLLRQKEHGNKKRGHQRRHHRLLAQHS